MAALISDLAGVSAWLATLAVGDAVKVGSAQFAGALATGLFALLPKSDPVEITITAVDAGAATLTGTGTILEEDDTNATFAWSQTGTTLAVKLTLALPATTAWPLVSKLEVELTGITATFAPNLDAGTFGLSFEAQLVVGTMAPIPVTLAAPSLAADWTLTAGAVAIGALDRASLSKLGGGHDPMATLPPEFTLEHVSLTGVELAFDPTADTLSSIGLGLAYTKPWQFFDDQFVVENIELDLVLRAPLGASPATQAVVTATMALPSVDFKFQLGGLFPDQAVFAALPPGTQLDLTEVMNALGADLPAGFPPIALDAFAFSFFVPSKTVAFEIGIDTPFQIVGSVELVSFHFALQAVFGTSPAQVTGALRTVVQLGTSTPIALSGSYAASGLSMAGAIQNLPIGTLIDDLATSFGYTAPAALGSLEIKTLGVALTTGDAPSFSFTLDASAKVAAALVKVDARVDVAYANRAWTGSPSGTLAITTAAGNLTFAIAFSHIANDASISASYTGAPFGLDDLIHALGLGDQPVIPPDLDLALTTASFTYHFTSGDFTFSAQSQSYGKLTLSSKVVSGVRSFTATLATGQAFSLSNLPLVGAELAKIATVENITIDDLAIVITSEPSLTASAVVNFGGTPMPRAISLGGAAIKTTALATTGGGRATSTITADGTTWYTVQRSFGPVTIDRIGASYQSDQQTLWFALDASFTLGPLTLGLSGLGIGSPLTSFAPQFTLAGLTIGYQSGPLTLAGSLVNLDPPHPALGFAGGLTIGAASFVLTAFGYYGDGAGFPSMFVFGDLAHDFGGPPAFFITGVAFGLGYNTALRTPTLAQLGTFPLLAALPGSFSPTGALSPTTPPLTALQTLLAAPAGGGAPWVSAQQGSLWLAAGLTFTSFSLIQSQAMIVVELGDDLVIDLLGVSRAQFPQTGGTLYAHVELELEAQLDPASGVFSIQAVLAPSSFLLDQACVLTGGFAFFVWYGPSPHAGDFVLTLGGYNAGFTPPRWYPAVPEVGFHWSIDSSITVTGAAYLAITPAVFMAGGRLEATYQAGNLKAWFDVQVDVTMRWKPFWLDATIGLTVGASYKLDLLFTTATISVELGCELDVWGPPTGGSVLVDWYVVKFRIDFGSKPKPVTPTIGGWGAVVAMLPSASPTAPLPLTVKPVAGLIPAANAPDGTTRWTVRGSQLAFTTASAIPASTVTVGSQQFAGASFAVYPLGWIGVTATHAVMFTDADGCDRTSALAIATTAANVPASLWGAPPTSSSGGSMVPSGTDQLVANQLVGVTATVLAPTVGATAGPMSVAAQLAPAELGLPGAVLPLSPTAPPSGDVPVASATALATIADATAGIASPTAIAARKALLAALEGAGYAPATQDDSMAGFVAHLGCAFAAQPLLVTGS